MSEAVRIARGPRPEGARRQSISLAKSVQAKFLLYVVPLVLVSTAVVLGRFEWNSRRSAEQLLQAKLDKLIDIQSSMLAGSLWNVVDQQIELIRTCRRR